MFAPLIGLSPKTGIALAIIRKLRMLFWAVTGGILLVRAGLSGRARSVQIPSAD